MFVDGSHDAFEADPLLRPSGRIESYLKGHVWIKAFVGLRSLEVKPNYFVALFQGFEIEGRLRRNGAVLQSPPHEIGIDRAGDDKQKSVLVRVHEHVQDGKPVIRRHGSLVRLYGFESIEDANFCDPHHARRSYQAGLPVDLRTVDDRESVVLSGISVLKFGELVVQVIESGSHVGEEVAQDQSPLGIYDGKPFYPIDILRGLTIELTEHTVSARLQREVDTFLKVAGVHTGPTEFGVNAVQVSH